MRRFLYDSDELVAEYYDTGNMAARYVHGLGIDDPVVWYHGAFFTNRRHLLADWQGSPMAVTDAAGALIADNALDEYGMPQVNYGN